jgi:phage repressor protein C with HTH and peptisase S24 domain
MFVTPPTIGERLKAVRLEYEHDIETMADFLTVTPEEYRRYEANEADPPEEVLKRLEGNFNVSSRWARSGTGEKDTLAPKSALRRENGHLVSFAEIGKDSFVVPLLDQSVAAGESSTLTDTDNITGYIRLPQRLRSYGSSLAALPVRGDSMYPTIDDGDLVVCDTGKWQGEGIYVIRLDNEALVKRLSKRPSRVMVISDNPQYPAFEVTGETPLDVVGRVRAVVKLVR